MFNTNIVFIFVIKFLLSIQLSRVDKRKIGLLLKSFMPLTDSFVLIVLIQFQSSEFYIFIVLSPEPLNNKSIVEPFDDNEFNFICSKQ